MKKIFLLMLVAIVLVMAGCNIFSPYGKAVKINDSLEVYIKGDSTTEIDAKKLGNYLADLWKENKNHKSVQLIKQRDLYIVKMVANEKALQADPSLESAFSIVRALIEENVFKGRRVKLIITDDKFKDLKSFDSSPDIPIPTKDSTNK